MQTQTQVYEIVVSDGATGKRGGGGEVGDVRLPLFACGHESWWVGCYLHTSPLIDNDIPIQKAVAYSVSSQKHDIPHPPYRTQVLNCGRAKPNPRTISSSSITHPIDGLIDASVLIRGVDGSLGRKQQVPHEPPADFHVLAPVPGAVHIVREDGLHRSAI